MSLLMVRKSAAGEAQDSGDYTTNAEALLKMAYQNLFKAETVARRVVNNLGSGISRAKDEQTKSFLKDRERQWGECLKDIVSVSEDLLKIAVPPSYGVPHKEKLPPEDRKILAAFFGM